MSEAFSMGNTDENNKLLRPPIHERTTPWLVFQPFQSHLPVWMRRYK